MKYFVEIEGREVVVEVDDEGITVDGVTRTADLRRVGRTALHSLVLDGASHAITAERLGDEWAMGTAGGTHRVTVVDERTRAIRELTGAGQAARGPVPLKAPMPGLVLRVDVEPGQTVEVGQSLVIVEAMKMENELRAEAPGRVTVIRVEAGAAVERDAVLIEFESVDSDE